MVKLSFLKNIDCIISRVRIAVNIGSFSSCENNTAGDTLYTLHNLQMLPNFAHSGELSIRETVDTEMPAKSATYSCE